MAFSRSGNAGAVESGVGLPVSAALRRVSWGAILAGVVVALAVQVLLAMLGAGVGLTAIEPTQSLGDNPTGTTMGIGAAIWWALSGIIASFIGGWVAARLAGQPDKEVGRLHGLAVWAVAMLAVLYLLSSTATSIVGGAFNAVGQTISSAGSAVSNTVSGVANQMGNPVQMLQDEISTATNTNDPQAAGRQLLSTMTRAFTSEGEAANQARQNAVDLLVRQGVPQPEAEQRVQGWVQQYNETRDQAAQQARDAADAAADGVATAAFYGFIGLLLGAIAGAVGGQMGTPGLSTVVTDTRRART